MAAVVLLLLGPGLSACAVAGSDVTMGDPGGRVLRELSHVSAAVPPGSTNIHSSAQDARWSPKCSDNPSGRAGWSGVEELTTFSSIDTAQAVLGEVGSALRTQGWKPIHPLDDAAWQYTPVAEWSKFVPGTWSSRAVLFSYPPDQGPAPGAPGLAWMLGTEGKTPGYALPGC